MAATGLQYRGSAASSNCLDVFEECTQLLSPVGAQRETVGAAGGNGGSVERHCHVERLAAVIAWFHLLLVVRSPSPPNSGVVDVRRTQSALAAADFQAVGCTRCDDLWGQILIYGSYAFVGGYRGVPQLFRPIGPQPHPPPVCAMASVLMAPPASAVTFAVYSTPPLKNFITTGVIVGFLIAVCWLNNDRPHAVWRIVARAPMMGDRQS